MTSIQCRTDWGFFCSYVIQSHWPLSKVFLCNNFCVTCYISRQKKQAAGMGFFKYYKQYQFQVIKNRDVCTKCKYLVYTSLFKIYYLFLQSIYANTAN